MKFKGMMTAKFQMLFSAQTGVGLLTVSSLYSSTSCVLVCALSFWNFLVDKWPMCYSRNLWINGRLMPILCAESVQKTWNLPGLEFGTLVIGTTGRWLPRSNSILIVFISFLNCLMLCSLVFVNRLWITSSYVSIWKWIQAWYGGAVSVTSYHIALLTLLSSALT